MFDMGFLELMVVLVVGLLVIGPEKLPGAIKTCAIWINGIRRSISSAREEFEKQIGADDIRREIHNQQVMESLRKAQQKQEEMRQQIANGNYTGVFNSGDDDEASQPAETARNAHLTSTDGPLDSDKNKPPHP